MNKYQHSKDLFKHLRKNSKQILSFMLAFAILTENPLSAYASASSTNLATSSNITETDPQPTEEPILPMLPITRKPVVIDETIATLETIPDEIEVDEDDLEEILGAGANCIDDFDPDNLVPLSPEAVEYIENYVPEDPDINPVPVNIDNGVSTQIVGEEVAIPVIFCLLVWWASYSSALSKSQGTSIYNTLDSYSTSFTPTTFSYLYKGVAKSINLTQNMFTSLKAKLDSAGLTDTVTFTDEDKAAFAYIASKLGNGYKLASFSPENINIKAIDGFKYYYHYVWTDYVDATSKPYGSMKVLYTPNKVAFGTINGYKFYFYFYNSVTTEPSFEKMSLRVGAYELNANTRLYEFSDSVEADYITIGPSSYLEGSVYSLPFPICKLTYKDKATDYILAKDVALLDYSYGIRYGSLDALMDLKSVTLKNDIDSIIGSEKNIFASVTGLNVGAGTVTGTTTDTDTGTDTKPGTDTGDNSGENDGGKDYSGSLTQIISSLASLAAGVSILQNILTAINDLPGTLAQKIATAIDNSILAELVRSILSAIETIQDWDIEAWLTDCADNISDTFESCVSRITDILDDLPTAEILKTIISSVLSGSSLTTAAIAIENLLEKGNIISFGDEYKNALSSVLNALGFGSLASLLQMVIDATTAGFGEVVGKVGALEDVLAGLGTGISLGDLADALENLLTLLGLGSVAGILTGILDVVQGLTLTDVIEAIRAIPASIVAAVTEAMPNWFPQESEESENDSGFQNFLNLFMIGLLIIILLMILFINCLRFIVLVFNIPASSALIHADMLKGIEYMKSLEIPVFGVSLYTLLLSCAYFVIFMTVIAAIRRKIDKMHV